MKCANCDWSRANHSHRIAAALTCGNFSPFVAPTTKVIDYDRCETCGDYNTWVSSGGRCKCDRPKMPRHLMNNDDDDRPTPIVRYGN